ncbi:hypothetical protein M569_17099 [Genlisea aurea]|uniref:Uncharacterized protein n=1 Tax=Genlisea aurea TaxID=192259 RepID=S8D4U8_9LAMI|nr:hypothetical protein M569_17099 [Genlisea aurea]
MESSISSSPPPPPPPPYNYYHHPSPSFDTTTNDTSEHPDRPRNLTGFVSGSGGAYRRGRRRFKSLVGSCWYMADHVQPSLRLAPHHHHHHSVIYSLSLSLFKS